MRKLIIASLFAVAACGERPVPPQTKVVKTNDCFLVDIEQGGLARFCRFEPDPQTVCWISSYKDTISCLRKEK